MAEFRVHLPPGDAPVLSENAVEVLRSRYLVKDRRGECIETPAQLFSRVAWSVAGAEAAYGAGRSEVKRWRRSISWDGPFLIFSLDYHQLRSYDEAWRNDSVSVGVMDL